MSNSKLSILANGKPMTLSSDFSISVELRNPLFNDDEMFSYPVDLPFEGNRHFLKNLDDPSAAIRLLERPLCRTGNARTIRSRSTWMPPLALSPTS